jgi:hypothetical protein
LRSELDEPAVLPPAFSDLAAQVAHLQAEYESGRLTRSSLAEQLDQAKVVHTDGSQWTIGASSGQWYLKLAGGGGWQAALPPEGTDPAIAAPSTPPGVLEPVSPLGTTTAPDMTAGTGEVTTPWPEVHGAASTQPLPALNNPSADLIDDDGVWDVNWETAGRAGTSYENDVADWDTTTPPGHPVWGMAASGGDNLSRLDDLSSDPSVDDGDGPDDDLDLPPEFFGGGAPL